MTTFKPWPHQQAMVDLAIERLFLDNKLGVAWFADPGLGKTATALHLVERLKNLGEVNKVLIIAPLRVATGTWPEQINEWGFDLPYSVVHGSPKKRREALAKDAVVYTTNPENTVWLANENVADMFDLLIVDESTKFKSWMSKRSMAMRNKVLPCIPRRVIMTGTPAPNCDSELFGQFYIVDDGEALGKTITYFRSVYMRPGGFKNHGWEFLDHMHETLWTKVAPATIRLDMADNLQLPEKITNKIWVDLPPAVMRQYRKLERELFYELDNGRNVLATGSGDKYHKTRGAANGGFYEQDEFDEKITHQIHDAKTEACVDLVDELNGKPVMIGYPYRHDHERLIKAFPDAETINGDTSVKRGNEIIEAWNRKEIGKLLVQPTTIEHGVNMQFGGSDLIWYGITDRTESHLQLNARLRRPGQAEQVRYHYILARNTIDVAVWQAWKSKNRGQQALLQALKEYRNATK